MSVPLEVEPMDQNEDDILEEQSIAESAPLIRDQDQDQDRPSEDYRKSGEWRAADIQHEKATARMTASYTKISFEERDEGPQEKEMDTPSPGPSECPPPPTRPDTLSCNVIAKPLDLDGTVSHDGDMTHFVADDLEYRIKISSPVSKKSDSHYFNQKSSRSETPLYRRLLAPQVGQVDVSILNDLENEARRIALSVDNLIENLSNILHANSSITADNIEVYKDAVSKTCDAMDSNIKSMYTILAKGEEVSQAMIPVQAHAVRVGEIRRLLQLFENSL